MHKIPSDISIGTDLELFLYDNEKKQVVPCVGILEGNKEHPFRPDGYKKGFAIQEDNVMVEYNIPPARSSMEFYKAVRVGRKMVLNELEARHGSKYSLYTKTHVHEFSKAELKSDQAQTIGCEPDYDAYEGGYMRTDPPDIGLIRSCGGHIHFGGDFRCPDFVAALFAELFIGVRAMVYAAANDPRAKWYGKPGIYRPKPYGIEYRTPTNKWSISGAGCEVVAQYALRCARYLTETDAVGLQTAFRKIPWTQVREFMLSNKRLDSSKKLRADLFKVARSAGVPL